MQTDQAKKFAHIPPHPKNIITIHISSTSDKDLKDILKEYILKKYSQ